MCHEMIMSTDEFAKDIFNKQLVLDEDGRILIVKTSPAKEIDIVLIIFVVFFLTGVCCAYYFEQFDVMVSVSTVF